MFWSNGSPSSRWLARRPVLPANGRAGVLAATFQAGYTAFSVTIAENGIVRALRGEHLRFGKHTTIEDCSALMFNR